MKASRYITPEGYARLTEELENLWRRERPRVVQAVSEAAALGDRSENAEYIYGKKQLREIDRRVRFLRKRLDGMVVVREQPSDTERVFFGAWVTLEDSDGKEQTLRIVGPDEFNPQAGWISVDSPMARALLGRTIGDEIRVRLPEGIAHHEIVAVNYAPPQGVPSDPAT
ncbi:MAG: transcription elongation factor GreB [Halothiobacillaceae bacterium]